MHIEVHSYGETAEPYTSNPLPSGVLSNPNVSPSLGAPPHTYVILQMLPHPQNVFAVENDGQTWLQSINIGLANDRNQQFYEMISNTSSSNPNDNARGISVALRNGKDFITFAVRRPETFTAIQIVDGYRGFLTYTSVDKELVSPLTITSVPDDVIEQPVYSNCL